MHTAFDPHGFAKKTKSGPGINEISATLLTGGADRPYVYGLATSLITSLDRLEIVGSDDLDFSEFKGHANVSFLNLRGSHRSDVSILKKALRLLSYYIKLILYAATTRTKIFHILWNNKFETFDRTLLMLYYRLLGKRIALTAHNINAGARDSNDSWMNRFTLRIQYGLVDQLFVHTEKMKSEVIADFGIEPSRVIVIPFGINNSIPVTAMTTPEARQCLGILNSDKVILFFGNITPYKGLEYLVEAFQLISQSEKDYRLVIAGRPAKCPEYWSNVRQSMSKGVIEGKVLLKDSFIPDEEVELYFKAADILVIPYRHVFQSGVLFLGQSFGIPTIATDVGSLKDDIVEGKTGFVVPPDDSGDLARAISGYFRSDLYKNLEQRRGEIRELALKSHSWDTVAQITMNIYARMLRMPVDHAQSTVPVRDASDVF